MGMSLDGNRSQRSLPFCLGQDAAGQMQELRHLLRLNGRRKEETLAVVTAHLPEEVELFSRFDAFGHPVHAECAREIENGADDLQRLVSVGHAADEGAVDFEHVEREGVKVVE